jgi:hypothetical protein
MIKMHSMKHVENNTTFSNPQWSSMPNGWYTTEGMGGRAFICVDSVDRFGITVQGNIVTSPKWGGEWRRLAPGESFTGTFEIKN